MTRGAVAAVFGDGPPREATARVPSLAHLKGLLSATGSMVMASAGQLQIDVRAMTGGTPYDVLVSDMAETAIHEGFMLLNTVGRSAGFFIDTVENADDLRLDPDQYMLPNQENANCRILVVRLTGDVDTRVNYRNVRDWPDVVGALLGPTDVAKWMTRFSSLSSMASGIAGRAAESLKLSSKLGQYEGHAKADALAADMIAAAVASGAAHFDDGSRLVFAHLGPLNDDAELDKMVTAAEGAGRGILLHGVVGAQFLHSGHHLSDSALAIQQVVTTAATLLPSDQTLPRVEERGLSVATFYVQSKLIGTRGSVFSALIVHSRMPRVGRLTLRLWGSREGTASAHLAHQVLTDIRALFPGAVAMLSAAGITADTYGCASTSTGASAVAQMRSSGYLFPGVKMPDHVTIKQIDDQYGHVIALASVAVRDAPEGDSLRQSASLIKRASMNPGYAQLHESLLSALQSARSQVLRSAAKAIGDLGAKKALNTMAAVTSGEIAALAIEDAPRPAQAASADPAASGGDAQAAGSGQNAAQPQPAPGPPAIANAPAGAAAGAAAGDAAGAAGAAGKHWRPKSTIARTTSPLHFRGREWTLA